MAIEARGAAQGRKAKPRWTGHMVGAANRCMLGQHGLRPQPVPALNPAPAPCPAAPPQQERAHASRLQEACRRCFALAAEKHAAGDYETANELRMKVGALPLLGEGEDGGCWLGSEPTGKRGKRLAKAMPSEAATERCSTSPCCAAIHPKQGHEYRGQYEEERRKASKRISTRV